MQKIMMPTLAVLTLLVLAGCSGSTSAGNSSSSSSRKSSSSSSSASSVSLESARKSDAAIALSKDMRKLWSDHVFWTREYVIAAVAGTPDTQAIASRLLKNQDDIGNAIVPYYGRDAGTQLANLLRQHILIAVDLVNAAKANDQTKLNDADTRWSANARDIAAFLGSANTNWPEQQMVDMLNNHLRLTKDEAVARLQGDWSGSISKFDAIYPQALEMADGLTDGIIQQFPQKFQ